MDVESRQMRYLAAIGRHGTFVSAAKALRISQPALSLSIQRLEDITKTPLVTRGRKGADLTEAGQLLARRSEEVDVTIASVLTEIALLTRGISGRLRVGGTPLSTSSIIPAATARVLEQSQDVAIEIVEAVDEDLLEHLEMGRLDLVICASVPTASDRVFDFTPLFEAKTVLAMRKGHALADRDSVSLDLLADALWAMPPAGGTFRRQIEALFTTAGQRFPERTVQAASVATLIRIVRMSDAISLLSAQLIADELRQGSLRFVEISHSLAPRVFGLYRCKGRRLSKLGTHFEALVTDIAPDFAA